MSAATTLTASIKNENRKANTAQSAILLVTKEALDFILWYIPCIMESSVRGAFQPFTEYPLSKYFPGLILVLAINVIAVLFSFFKVTKYDQV